MPPALVVRGFPESEKETYPEAVKRILRERQALHRKKLARTVNSPSRRKFDRD